LNVLEITSEEPGAGKTHLLFLLAAIAVLPQSYAGVVLNGMYSTIVVLDTDNRFCVQRLIQIMRHYIEQQCKNEQENTSAITDDNAHPRLDEATTSHLISISLQHIHIFRPQSLPSLLATLSSLPTYLLTATAHHSSNRPLHSVLLDSATAFYWHHRAASETMQLSHPGPQPEPTYTHLVHTLRSLAQLFSCPVIATTSPPFVTSTFTSLSAAVDVTGGGTGVGLSARPQALRHFMPHPWPAFVTVRLRVARVAVPRFALGLSVEEAMGEREERQKEVERGRFVAVADDGHGGFGFRICAEGVEVE
jgi:hypothetical protein